MTVASLATITHSRPRDAADAGDDARAGRVAVVEVVRGERAQLEERRAGVEQAVDALARQQLAALGVAGARLLAAALRGRVASCAWRSSTSCFISITASTLALLDSVARLSPRGA